MSSSSSQSWKELLDHPKKQADLSPQEWSLQSRRLLVQCYFTAKKDEYAAVALYRKHVKNGEAYDYVRPDRELKYWMTMWVLESSVHDRPHRHREPEVPDDVIREFAAKLASGHATPIYTFVNDEPVMSLDHRPYFSLSQAAACDPFIADVVRRFRDKSALLHRAKELEPELHCGFMHIRLEPTAELKQLRMAFALRQLQRIASERDFLLNTLCEDEFAMYLANPKDYVVKSWGFRSAQAHALPEKIKILGEDDNQVKLHIMLVVSPRYGVVWCNFLTGTSAVDGGHIHLEGLMAESIARRNAVPFKTAKSGFTVDARGPTHQEMRDNFEACIVKVNRLVQGRHPIYITRDNPKIHPKAEELPSLGLPAAADLGLPPHSPDFHMLVEHTNNRVKSGINIACTNHGFCNLDASKWCSIVRDVAKSITPESIRADLANLITCYKIVSTPEGDPVPGLPDWVRGTGGGYTHHMFS